MLTSTYLHPLLTDFTHQLTDRHAPATKGEGQQFTEEYGSYVRTPPPPLHSQVLAAQVTGACTREGNLRRGHYIYSDDIQALERCVPMKTSTPSMSMLETIVSPLSDALEAWAMAMAEHPDSQFKNYIVEGLRRGFRIGFDYGKHSCVPAHDNLPSVVSHLAVVQQYLEKECSLGRMVGPLPTGSTPGLQISPFGVIPKDHTPGKWRLIVDLSHPEGRSVNDGISKEQSSLAYVSVDHIVQVILRLGRGTQMAKIDIRSAYRVIPVHPEDRLLLGMQWGAWEYIDCVLPFGLRSAPKRFNSVADALQ